MVLCPKHNVEMQIECRSIDVCGSIYETTVGICPICKELYIGNLPMMNASIVTIDNVRYQYLACLDDVKPSQKDVSDSSKAKKTTQKINKEYRAKAKAIAIEQERQKREAFLVAKNCQKTKDEKRKEQVIQETYDRIVNNNYAYYHAKKIIFDDSKLNKCEYDNEPLTFVERVVIEYDGKEVKTDGCCCLRCRTLYIREPKIFLSKLQDKKNPSPTQSSDMANPPKAREVFNPRMTEKAKQNQELDFGNQNNILYICKGIIFCEKNNHEIESVTGIIENTFGVPIKINANYCKQCKKYFIDYSEYSHYRKLYGAVMGNFRIWNNGRFGGLYDALSEESVLHLCGYTVNQTDDLAEKQRRYILEYLVTHNIMNKAEIISHLEFLLKTNGKKRNMPVAISRWNSDVEWIRNFRLDSQRHFRIHQIKKNR